MFGKIGAVVNFAYYELSNLQILHKEYFTLKLPYNYFVKLYVWIMVMEVFALST